MAMTTETRTEIILFTALAAFLVFLWWLNRAAGAGSGLAGLRQSLTDPNAAPLFNVTIPGGGGVNYNAGDVSFGGSTFNVGGPSLGAALPGACNCGSNSAAPVFGSLADMSAFLAANPDFTSAAANGLTNWN